MTALDKLIEAVEAGGMIHMTYLRRAITNGADRVDFHQAYHGCLDAALALHEALLPGCGWKTQKLLCNDYYTAEVWGEYAYSEESGTSHTPARAWLIAILRAYRSVQA